MALQLPPQRVERGAIHRPRTGGSQRSRRRGHVALQPRQRRGRIQRRRYDAGNRRTEERRQKLLGVREDERGDVGGAEADGAKAGRHAARHVMDLRVRPI